MKKYLGVWLNPKTKKWQSKVTFEGVIYHCGKHDTPESAAKARDIRIIEKGLPQSLQILKPKPNV